MILVVGGAFQGKKEYVEETFQLSSCDMLDGADCVFEELSTSACIYHFHEFVKKELRKGEDLKDLADKLSIFNPDLIIISNELGYGVVPMDAFDRTYREAVGRICTQIAKRSNQVHRVICGIGTVIKSEG